jgi:ribosomal-protein-serine acetyltransferase
MPDAPASLALDDGLYLRHLTLGDAPIVFATVDANRDQLRRWLPWVDHTHSVADTFAFLLDTFRQHGEATALVYGLWRDLDFCGVIGLHDIDSVNGAAQIGYWLAPAAQGQGLMLHACAALVGVGFNILGLERIEIRCAAGNHRSAAVPVRLGFVEEGTLRHAQRHGDAYVDLRVFSLLSDEYRRGLAGLAEPSSAEDV